MKGIGNLRGIPIESHDLSRTTHPNPAGNHNEELENLLTEKMGLPFPKGYVKAVSGCGGRLKTEPQDIPLSIPHASLNPTPK